MEGMEQVFDVIIGVFEDDSRPIPQTAPTATSTTTGLVESEFIFYLRISQLSGPILLIYCFKN